LPIPLSWIVFYCPARLPSWKLPHPDSLCGRRARTLPVQPPFPVPFKRYTSRRPQFRMPFFPHLPDSLRTSSFPIYRPLTLSFLTGHLLSQILSPGPISLSLRVLPRAPPFSASMMSTAFLFMLAEVISSCSPIFFPSKFAACAFYLPVPTITLPRYPPILSLALPISHHDIAKSALAPNID